MIEEMQLRNYSPKTLRLYIDHVIRLARYFDRSPDELGTSQIREYLLYLVRERKVAWGTYKQALAAFRFFYRFVLNRADIVSDIRCPRPERHLPVVLSMEEVRRFFAEIRS